MKLARVHVSSPTSERRATPPSSQSSWSLQSPEAELEGPSPELPPAPEPEQGPAPWPGHSNSSSTTCARAGASVTSISTPRARAMPTTAPAPVPDPAGARWTLVSRENTSSIWRDYIRAIQSQSPPAPAVTTKSLLWEEKPDFLGSVPS
nr:NADPH oxidase activator-like [Equus caballus]